MEIRNGRRYRTKAERRQIVEETLKPGVSVSQVARAHDVNANIIFCWRRQYREGWFDDVKAETKALVPVKLEQPLAAKPVSKAAESAGSGVIEIELGHARVRIEGLASPDCVRAALEGLSR